MIPRYRVAVLNKPPIDTFVQLWLQAPAIRMALA